MRQIQLTQDKFTLVDDADYEWLNQWKWCAHKIKNKHYAVRGERNHKTDKNIYGSVEKICMGRLILGITNSKILCKYRDRDGLNNQKKNLFIPIKNKPKEIVYYKCKSCDTQLLKRKYCNTCFIIRRTKQQKEYRARHKESMYSSWRHKYQNDEEFRQKCLEKQKNRSWESIRKIPIKTKEEKRLSRNEYHRSYYKQYFKDDPSQKIAKIFRQRLWRVLKNRNVKIEMKILIGCTKEFLKQYLENRFKIGMSWDNYSMNGWHIDHIKPCCKFNLENLEELKKCFHYTNLQPLWAKENLSKGRKTLEKNA